MTPAPRRWVSSPPLFAPNCQLKPLEPAEDPQTGLKHPKFLPPPPSRMASTAHDPPEPRYDRFVMQAPTAALSAAAGGAACSAVSASAAVLYDRRGARRDRRDERVCAQREREDGGAAHRRGELSSLGWQADLKPRSCRRGMRVCVARLRRFSLTLAHKRSKWPHCERLARVGNPLDFA